MKPTSTSNSQQSIERTAEQRAIAELIEGSNVIRQIADRLAPAIVTVAEQLINTLQAGAKLFELCSQTPHISMHLYPCEDRPTTTKTRILAHSQQLLRTDREERHYISAEAEANILTCFQERLDGLHACVLSDYAKGVLTDNLLSVLITLCNEAHIPIIVDPKGHRYFRYRGATVVTPNTTE